MFEILRMVLIYPWSLLRPQHELAMEALALRHQITVLNAQAEASPVGPVALDDTQESLAELENPLMIFRPETVIGWQRAGLRMFWRWKSRPRHGRPGKDRELIQLIRRMWTVNPTWGSPRIRDELAKLGLQASTATIGKYRPRSWRQPSQSWRTFLQNHAGAIAAMDFFVVPTVTCRLLYVLVVMNHERRKIVHFNITDAPTAA